MSFLISCCVPFDPHIYLFTVPPLSPPSKKVKLTQHKSQTLLYLPMFLSFAFHFSLPPLIHPPFFPPFFFFLIICNCLNEFYYNVRNIGEPNLGEMIVVHNIFRGFLSHCGYSLNGAKISLDLLFIFCVCLYGTTSM